jgi:polyisoprenoid-binding protein YceI
MKRLSLAAVVATVALAFAAPSFAAESYKVDPVHSTAIFRIKHANVSFFSGRFNEPGGSFTLDEADPTKSSFNIVLTADKVDTANDQRNGHLKSPDFFNAKQYPTIEFKSTSVKKAEGNVLHVTGNLTMHGVTKSITVPVELTGKGQFPAGVQRAGVEATFVVKRSDFGMSKMLEALSDDVKVVVGLSGMKQ